MGGRRTRKHKTRKHKRKTRRGGAAFPSFGSTVTGANGQPAGASFTAISTAGTAPYAASSYNGAPSTSSGYEGQGGRRRSRRSRRSRRHRMRGGTGGEGVGYGFRGEVGDTNWPIADRSIAPTTTHV
jgi:hypothetical protein